METWERMDRRRRNSVETWERMDIAVLTRFHHSFNLEVDYHLVLIN